MNCEVAAHKVTAIQRCVSQARMALEDGGEEFKTSYLFQDAAVLNVIRACEASIDLANMLIRSRRLGIPTESRESFSILARENLIATDLSERLERMVGFRNLAVHRYRDLDLDIVETVIRKDLDDLLAFAQTAYSVLSD